MTYCLGWKTDNHTYLLADAAVTSSQPHIADRSSFGELHVKMQSKSSYEGALKIIPFDTAALTFSGNTHTGNSIVRTLRMALDAGDSHRQAFNRAIDSNMPFSEGREVRVLFAYFENGNPQLVSFNAQSHFSYSDHPAGEVVQIGTGSADRSLAALSDLFVKQMQDLAGEGAPLIACVLAYCQLHGVHNNLIELVGVGGTFAGGFISAEGFHWQPDIGYLVSDIATICPEVAQSSVFVAVREDVLAVRSTLVDGPVRLFTTTRPSETVEGTRERCQEADVLTLEVLRRQDFEFIVVLNTRVPIAGVIKMARKMVHRDVIIEPWIEAEGVGLFQLRISSELWTILCDTCQELAKSGSEDGSVLGPIIHYRSYFHPRFDVKHEGFEVEFFDENETTKPKILPEILEAYQAAKDTAGVFVQNRDGQCFCAAHLLTWWLKKEDKELEDFVPDSVKRPEGNSVVLHFSINFTRNSFHMLTNHGPLDIKRLTLFVRINWLPTKVTPPQSPD